jgi:L-threonylcarbamoyladenylate synthase
LKKKKEKTRNMHMPEVVSMLPLDRSVHKATSALSRGGVIVYPTETVYGLGVLVEREEGLEKIRQIKGREKKHTFLVLVSGEEMADRYVFLTPLARKLVRAFPENLSLILFPKEGFLQGVRAEDGTVGIRFSSHPFCQVLVRACGVPLVSTSANGTGRMPEKTCGAVLESFGVKAKEISCAIDGGVCCAPPSTIVDVREGEVRIVREGGLSREMIRKAGFELV